MMLELRWIDIVVSQCRGKAKCTLHYKTSLVSGWLMHCKLLRFFFFLFPMEIVSAELVMHTHSLFPQLQNSSLVPHEKNGMQM